MKLATNFINESSYKTYHESYTSAIESALAYAESKGYEYNETESAQKIGLDSKRPSGGSTTKIHLQLYKNDKLQSNMLHIQVTDLGNTYELNCYIN